MRFGKLENAFRLSVPLLLFAAFLLAGFVALPVADADMARPHLVLMAVYYWSIYRPTLVPPALCFAAGLAIDILSGGPLGPNALLLTAAQWIVSDQRRYLMSQPYTTLWAGFGFVAGAAAALQWALHSLLAGRVLPPLPAAVGAGVDLLLFPAVTLLLVLVHRLLPVASRSIP